MESLCRDIPKAFPGKVRCETFGTTPEGRPMLALIASADGTFTAAANAKKGRPVVLFQGGIHAGEIEGKEKSPCTGCAVSLYYFFPGVLCYRSSIGRAAVL